MHLARSLLSLSTALPCRRPVEWGRCLSRRLSRRSAQAIARSARPSSPDESLRPAFDPAPHSKAVAAVSQLGNRRPETLSSADAATATFSSIGVPSHVTGKLPNMSLLRPTPVQFAAIPKLLYGMDRSGTSHAAPPYDVIVHAHTGSGKTLSYLLPILARLAPGDLGSARTRAIIVAPTRELSHQITAVAEALGRPGNKKDAATRTVRVLRAVGEISGQLLHELRTAPPHVLVGTPTALARLVPDVLNLSDLQFLVLDEADELVREHNLEAVRSLVRTAARLRNRPSVVAVSATGSPALTMFTQQWLRAKSIQRVDTTAAAVATGVIAGAASASSASAGLSTPPTLTHLRLAFSGGPGAAYPALLGLLRARPVPQAALVFCGSAASMEAAEAFLLSHGVATVVIGNAYTNAQRAAALHAVATGRAQALLSTEMAARGLDLPRLSHVVNFDLPHTAREYVHRAGRTGRLSSLTAGHAGVVVSLVGSPEDAAALDALLEPLGVAAQEATLQSTGGAEAGKALLVNGVPVGAVAAGAHPAPAGGAAQSE